MVLDFLFGYLKKENYLINMDLFGRTGIMTQIFSNTDEKWRAHKNNDKAKHAFMINRFFAIQYPTTAQQLNVNGFNPYVTIEAWRLLAKKLKRSPNWLFTKMMKAPKSMEKKSRYKPSDEVIKIYMKKNEISHSQFNDAMKFNKEVLLAYLKKIESQIAVYDK